MENQDIWRCQDILSMEMNNIVSRYVFLFNLYLGLKRLLQVVSYDSVTYVLLVNYYT